VRMDDLWRTKRRGEAVRTRRAIRAYAPTIVALRCVALRCAEFPLELVLSQRAKRSETRQDQMSVLRGEESARRRSHQKERPTIQSKVGCK
jgi:hypothetical protein